MHFLDNKYNEPQNKRAEKIAAALCIMLLIGFGLAAFLLPDTGPDLIKEQLSDRGVSTQEITFTRTDDKWQRIYQSSDPINIGEGDSVEFWTLINVSFSTYFPKWEAFPLPAKEWPSPVDVHLSFTTQEHSILLEAAGDIPLVTYIRSILMQEEDN